jgi:hypothetical protein
MPFPLDFLLNENMKDWILLPVWSTIVSGILTVLWKSFNYKRETPVRRQIRTAEFQANPFPQYVRTDIRISARDRDSSKSDGQLLGAMIMIVAILCLHVPFRVGVLNVLSIILGLCFGFCLAVSLFSVKQGTWSEDAWVIGCMLASCAFLLVGLEFTRDPPRPARIAVAAFLANGSWPNYPPSFNDILNLFEMGMCSVFGFFLLLHGPVKSMVFLGLGTVVRTLNQGNTFCSWLADLTSHTIHNRSKTFVVNILIEGTVGLLIIGGWAFEWFHNLWTSLSGLSS